MVNATPKVNPCNTLAGTNTRYRSSLKKYATRINSPVKIESVGKAAAPYEKAKIAKSPVNAPAGPTTLYRLPAKNEYISPDQIAVRIPCKGVAPEAIAKESESGIDIKATVKPDFQLDCILFHDKNDNMIKIFANKITHS
jgi:hypothetical protein